MHIIAPLLSNSTSLYYSFPSLDLDLVTGERDSSDKASSTPTGDELPEDGSLTPVQRELDDLAGGEVDNIGEREASGSEDIINIPSPIPEVDELIQNDAEDKVGVILVNGNSVFNYSLGSMQYLHARLLCIQLIFFL